MTEAIETTKETPEIIDLMQTNGQIQMKAYHYKMTDGNQKVHFATVLAPSSAVAREGLSQQLPNVLASYCGKSTIIIQCNG